MAVAVAPLRRDRGLREGDLRAVAPAAAAPSPTNALAERLGVTPASASAMVKKLAELGLVAHVPYKGVELTAAGERVALEVLRHHRLLELYLAEQLGVPWDRVHDEAEALEHVISRGARGADRREARRSHARPARRPDPVRRARDRRGRHASLEALPAAPAGTSCASRTPIRDAALAGRAGHRARRGARGRRPPAVRRAAVGPHRRRRARARRQRSPRAMRVELASPLS